MATDQERREVARRLRAIEPDDFSSYSEEHEFVEKALGIWDDYDKFLWHVVADLIEPQPITGDTSDGYHTFNELYDHRAKLFSVIVRCFKDRAWKSKLHSDGTMYDEMFIVGIETPGGQATYHYDLDPYWDIFDCDELDRAPEWDGHTPRQSIDRIAALGPSCDREALLRLADKVFEDTEEDVLSEDLVSAWQAGEALRDVASKIREACGEES